jgi:thiamine pyrophosphate-dependent acetolactate synthase large subunit-like protein
MSRHSTAHYFLEGLVDLGVDYIFANLGTDHVSLIEALACWDREGRKHPEMVLCPHEVVAVHMAAGYALATGRAQAVVVHVDAGTANACMAIQNLFRYRLPVLLFAGRAPYTLHGELPGSRDTYVHFVQDPFDIASIVRPYVKWEYSLPSGAGDSVMAVISGQVTATIADAGPVSSQIKGGKVRALAVSAPSRTEDLPDVPTMKEAGADVDAVLWSGIFAPRQTPGAIVQKLERELARIVHDPDVVAQFKTLGILPVGNSSAEFAHVLESDIARWTEVARAGNIRIEP